MLIEQAIFTSAETDRAAGYQIVAASAGVAEDDLRELATWGPSHDSLLDGGLHASSVNFHPLPSGAHCVSKTSSLVGEYSGRRGHRVYTQCLVVTDETLWRFSNNPFALLKAAFAQGSLFTGGEVPRRLEPFRLGGKAVAVDQALLGRLLGDPGAELLARLIAGALRHETLAVAGVGARDRVAAGLINCLPLECRPAFSFSTGLRFSVRRPFRLVFLTDDADCARMQRTGQPVLDLRRDAAPGESASSGWAGLVQTVLASGRLAFLSSQLSKRRDGLAIGDLARLAASLASELPAPTIVARPPCEGESELDGEPAPALPLDARAGQREAAEPDTCDGKRQGPRRADGAHLRIWRGAPAAVGECEPAEPVADGDAADQPSPATALGDRGAEAVEQLELLDDLVFEAIAGKPGCLDQLRRLWPQMQTKIGPQWLDESREQYLKHALRVWKECVAGDEIRNPTLALAAMDVVCLLFGDR